MGGTGDHSTSSILEKASLAVGHLMGSFHMVFITIYKHITPEQWTISIQLTVAIFLLSSGVVSGLINRYTARAALTCFEVRNRTQRTYIPWITSTQLQMNFLLVFWTRDPVLPTLLESQDPYSYCPHKHPSLFTRSAIHIDQTALPTFSQDGPGSSKAFVLSAQCVLVHSHITTLYEPLGQGWLATSRWSYQQHNILSDWSSWSITQSTNGKQLWIWFRGSRLLKTLVLRHR